MGGNAKLCRKFLLFDSGDLSFGPGVARGNCDIVQGGAAPEERGPVRRFKSSLTSADRTGRSFPIQTNVEHCEATCLRQDEGHLGISD